MAEPELLDTAIEEFLRAYAPVTMARIAAEDTDVAGCPVHAGDRILLPFPSGNRDPEKFDRPDDVIVDRERNRHFAFGIGIHPLPRLQPGPPGDAGGHRDVAGALPGFHLAPGTEVRWGGIQVRGPGRCRSSWAEACSDDETRCQPELRRRRGWCGPGPGSPRGRP